MWEEKFHNGAEQMEIELSIQAASKLCSLTHTHAHINIHIQMSVDVPLLNVMDQKN